MTVVGDVQYARVQVERGIVRSNDEQTTQLTDVLGVYDLIVLSVPCLACGWLPGRPTGPLVARTDALVTYINGDLYQVVLSGGIYRVVLPPTRYVE